MNSYKGFSLPYTICFCIAGDKVLMIYRYKEPNKAKWNGIGGKIEGQETPEGNLKREVKEEAGLEVEANITYGGIVTWKTYTEHNNKGMYAYIIRFKPNDITWQKKEIEEGLLEWKNSGWVCDKKNSEVVNNIPHFLPQMLQTKKPLHYHCEYLDKENPEKLTKFEVSDL